jgi:hypothetical protein
MNKEKNKVRDIHILIKRRAVCNHAFRFFSRLRYQNICLRGKKPGDFPGLSWRRKDAWRFSSRKA